MVQECTTEERARVVTTAAIASQTTRIANSEGATKEVIGVSRLYSCSRNQSERTCLCLAQTNCTLLWVSIMRVPLWQSISSFSEICQLIFSAGSFLSLCNNICVDNGAGRIWTFEVFYWAFRECKNNLKSPSAIPSGTLMLILIWFCMCLLK